MGTAVIGFSHVNLLVTDLAAARDFYGRQLGLAEIERPGDIGRGAWFQVGALQLHLSLVDEMPAGAARANSHVALQLPADAFDEVVGAMVERGLELTREPRSREQLGAVVRTAFCRDPSANLIELTDVALD